MGSFRYLFYTKDIFCKHKYREVPNQLLLSSRLGRMREDFRDQAIPLEKEKEEEKTPRIEVNESSAR
jgi:hypothetical protein